jgi:hypothetical protein
MIESYSTFTHFLTAGYSSRTANFGVLQVGFSGPRLGYGANWAAGKSLEIAPIRSALLSIEVTREMLSSSTSNKLQVTTFAAGAGIEL